MNFEHYDKQVRDASLRRAFPVESDTPERLSRLLERLSRETEPEDRRPADRHR